jgi:hypothetical protein
MDWTWPASKILFRKALTIAMSTNCTNLADGPGNVTPTADLDRDVGQQAAKSGRRDGSSSLLRFMLLLVDWRLK